MSEPMNELEFSFGLLFALRLAGVSVFASDGSGYHDAFGRVVEALNKEAPAPVEKLHWWGRDPMFGTYRQASQLILDGMHGALLTLDVPGYRVARLTFGCLTARRGLRRMRDHAELLERLGTVFAHALEERGLTIER